MYYSRIGRTKVSAITAEGVYFDSVAVQMCVSRSRSSEKTQDYYTNASPSNGGHIATDVNYDGATTNAAKDFYSKVITHEIGDSQSDAMMSRVIVEAVPFVQDGVAFGLYDYTATGNDYPKAYVYLRNTAFATVPNLFQKIIELVGLNMAAKSSIAGLNPWRSILQTPTSTNTYAPGTNEKASYALDALDVQSVHESFVLLAPLHSKFRRCRLKYVCKFTSILRAFTIEYNQYGRRFG